MTEKKAIIPIKDLIELHEKANFPIDCVFLKFKDYDWLAKFFGECFEYLYSKKKIKYSVHFFEDTSKSKYPRGLGALNKFISEKFGYKDFGIHDCLRRKGGVSVLVIAFLSRECGRKLEEIQPQILSMHLGKRRGSQNVSMAVLYILYNSKIALASYQISRMLEKEFGSRLSTKRIAALLNTLYHASYLVKHDLEGAPFYTLCGEEHKYKLK